MEAIDKIAWESWQEDQKTNPHSVNPHAYVYGFKAAFKKLKELRLIAQDETPVDHLQDMVNAMHGGANE